MLRLSIGRFLGALGWRSLPLIDKRHDRFGTCKCASRLYGVRRLAIDARGRSVQFKLIKMGGRVVRHSAIRLSVVSTMT